MKSILSALAIAASLSVSIAPAAHAMEAEINALVAALENALAIRGIESEGLEEMTITELRLVQQMLANGDSVSEMSSSISTFVND